MVEKRVPVGQGQGLREIAVEQRAGDAPGLFWLGGFKSDMAGSKALALDAFGADLGLMVTRFDYSGHGVSGGAFTDGTISRWLEEAEAVFALTEGEQILVGSSMGGWLALLLNKRLRARGENRIRGIVLIAPAVDMTHDLIPARFSEADRLAMAEQGYVAYPSAYSSEPYVYTRALIEDGARHLMFGAPIVTDCPIAILQGAEDPDVPPAHAQKLVSHLLLDPVTLTMVPHGDHRLSRPEDLALLTETVRRMVEG